MGRAIPGDDLDMNKMPGHWALAQLGKRVLRPGGLELTRRMLSELAIGSSDEVVEFAPGLGITARMALSRGPASYVAVERDEAAAGRVRSFLSGASQSCRVGTAEETGLADESASVVYGEAMLTMQTRAQKDRIIREAARVLRPGGRFAMHEICLVPDDIDEALVGRIEADLGAAIRVGVRPLRQSEWRGLVEGAGLKVRAEAMEEFRLLEPGRVIADEGILGALRLAFNMIRRPGARRRVWNMRQAIRRYSANMKAMMLVAIKEQPAGSR